MIHVVAGLLVHQHKLLAAQRHNYAYEFPGGKIEANESHQQALTRELYEELGIASTPHQTVATHHNDRFHLTLIYTTTNEAPQSLEHLNLAWVTPEEARALKWLPLDVPLLHKAIDFMKSQGFT